LVTVRNILELTSLKERVKAESGRTRYEGFIGSSRPMQAIYSAIENIAQSKATVFITGESGTGKELCAEAIHRRSPRSERPFIAINCGAIPSDLIETELFGHVKGAFTGAISDRDGAATLADGGTLFLDEICEMDVALQTKLLRFLQTGTLQRVGGQRTETVDLRVICATNRNPVTEVKDGRFREDLYYRLNVIPIHLPPLREREKDSFLVAEGLLKKISGEEGKQFSGFSQDAIDAILAYSWPGNVRELENVIRRVVVFHHGPQIKAEMFPEPIYGRTVTSPNQADHEMSASGDQAESDHRAESGDSDSWVPEGLSLAELEREIIEVAIRRCNDNIPEAANLLRVSPSTLYRKRAAWAQD
jgi:DNA-binding NtrC family response regulator